MSKRRVRLVYEEIAAAQCPACEHVEALEMTSPLGGLDDDGDDVRIALVELVIEGMQEALAEEHPHHAHPRDDDDHAHPRDDEEGHG